MDDNSVTIGQRFQKTDGTGMVFEVEEQLMILGIPHFRVALVNDRSDKRVLAVSTLEDPKIFLPAPDGHPLPAEPDGVMAVAAK